MSNSAKFIVVAAVTAMAMGAPSCGVERRDHRGVAGSMAGTSASMGGASGGANAGEGGDSAYAGGGDATSPPGGAGGDISGAGSPGFGGTLGAAGMGGVSSGAGSDGGGAGGVAGAGGADGVPVSSTIGMLGTPCTPDGSFGCTAHASSHQAVCRRGFWEGNGTCPSETLCDTRSGGMAGSCQKIVAGCAGKRPGDRACSGSNAGACGEDLVTLENVTACTGACLGGVCQPPPSCKGLMDNCGPNRDESCCASPLVQGGSFYITYDGVTLTDRTHPATVSDFRLDRFEVTVGRFRKFLAAWNSGWRPVAGDGKHTHLNGGRGLVGSSDYEAGWDTSYASNAAPTDANLLCDGSYQTWTATPGAGEQRPIVCTNWFEAAAFCIWDEGFLPSGAEWNYAASGGSEQRVYPWSVPATSSTIDCDHANYATSSGNFCVTTGTIAVGSNSPAGDGKFKQADLSGNTWEWNADWHNDALKPECHDCVDTKSSTRRAVRGGCFNNDASNQLSGFRQNASFPTDRGVIGIRCARPPVQ